MAVKEKTQEKQSRIWQYLKETHKWENYVFLIFSVLVLILGCLILTGALSVRKDFWLIGEHPKAFGGVLLELQEYSLFMVYFHSLNQHYLNLKRLLG